MFINLIFGQKGDSLNAEIIDYRLFEPHVTFLSIHFSPLTISVEALIWMNVVFFTIL